MRWNETIGKKLTLSATSCDWDSLGICPFSVRELNCPLPTTDLSDNFQSKMVVKTNTTNVDSDSAIQTQAAIKDLSTNKSHEYELQQSISRVNGTFRVIKSGTNKIMENIVFDFNADYINLKSDTASCSTSKNNDIDNNISAGIYLGAAGYHDPHSLGCFAGITIECMCNNVLSNLNECELCDAFQSIMYKLRFKTHDIQWNGPNTKREYIIKITFNKIFIDAEFG